MRVLVREVGISSSSDFSVVFDLDGSRLILNGIRFDS